MTLWDFFQAASAQPVYIVFYFVMIIVVALLTGWLAKGEGEGETLNVEMPPPDRGMSPGLEDELGIRVVVDVVGLGLHHRNDGDAVLERQPAAGPNLGLVPVGQGRSARGREGLLAWRIRLGIRRWIPAGQVRRDQPGAPARCLYTYSNARLSFLGVPGDQSLFGRAHVARSTELARPRDGP